MTTLAQIADQSGDVSALWGWPVWVFLGAVTLVIAAFLAVLNNPIPPLDPTERDTVDDDRSSRKEATP